MTHKRVMHGHVVAAAALLAAVDRGEIEVRYEDAPATAPRLQSFELLHHASGGVPSRGPKPRRKFPVRR